VTILAISTCVLLKHNVVLRMQQSELAVLMSSGSIFQHHTVNSGPIGLHACAVLETIGN